MSQKTLLLLLYSVIGGFGVYRVLTHGIVGNLPLLVGMVIYIGTVILGIVMVRNWDARYIETKYPPVGMVIYDLPPNTQYTTQYQVLSIDQAKQTMTLRVIGGYLPTRTNSTDPDYADSLEETFNLGGHTWYYIPTNQPTKK